MQTRLLIVLNDGTFAGASITDAAGSPIPLDLAALSAVLPDFNAASLAEIDQLQTDHAAAIAQLQAEHAAAIAQLQSDHAAALAAATAAPASDLLADLDAAFETLVPAEYRAAFAPAWVTVRGLVQAGKVGLAADFVRGLEVPEALAAARTQIADQIDGGL